MKQHTDAHSRIINDLNESSLETLLITEPWVAEPQYYTIAYCQTPIGEVAEGTFHKGKEVSDDVREYLGVRLYHRIKKYYK